MLKRQFPPIIQSFYGIYNSKIYQDFMAVYKDGVSYWFVDASWLQDHENEYIKRMKCSNVQRECQTSLQVYEQAYNNILTLLSFYEEHRGSFSNKELLNLLYDERFIDVLGNKSMAYLENEINNVETIFDNYGVIASCPEMAISCIAQEKLADKLSRVLYDVPRSELTDQEQLWLEASIEELIWYKPLYERAPYFDFERRVLEIAREIQQEINIEETIKDVWTEVTDTIVYSDCLVGSGLQYVLDKKIRSQLIEEIQQYQVVRNLYNEYKWLGSVWEFGQSLDNEDHEEIAKSICDYIIVNNLPSIKLAEMKLKQQIFTSRKDNLKSRIIEKARKRDIDANSQCFIYADIVASNQTNRFFRKCYLPMINEKIGNMMRDIAKLIGLTKWQDVHYLTMTDIVMGLRDGQSVDCKELERRKQSFLMVFQEGSISEQISGGKRVDEYLDNLASRCCLQEQPWPASETEWSDSSPIKGEAINMVKGQVVEANLFVLHSVHDLLNIEEGDIIVAPMIEPYHAVFMTGVGGIIVEDPGRLSHAVVIAQTKNIPIIVGARNITYAILRDEVRRVAMKWTGEIKKIDARRGKWALFA